MNADLRVIARYEENYNFYDGGELYWKTKGEREFIFPKVSSDLVMYYPNEVVEAIQAVLDKKSNEAFRYTFISKEILFFEPKELSTEELMEQIKVNW